MLPYIWTTLWIELGNDDVLIGFGVHVDRQRLVLDLFLDAFNWDDFDDRTIFPSFEGCVEQGLAESLQACCLCKKQELVEFHIGHAVIYFRIAFVGGCDEEIGNVHNVQYGHLLLGVHQSAWLIRLA